ncbi:MAG: glycogen/starch/alpha-glucan phosphorylase [Clostridia bacterium]|nr:glycogen/starch/alpha-glucan phosphorylase [Clostridia bacterium]
MTTKEAEELLSGKLSRYFGISFHEATNDQIYKAVAMMVRDMLLEKRKGYHQKVKSQGGKRVYYLCMEFLLGRSLKNNVYNLGIENELAEVLKKNGFDLEDMYELEPDAGLGNGGLGRLAACYMDGLATQDLPAVGFSIRYEYGLFKQKIVDGWQMELPDVWLPGGEVWLTQRLDKAYRVKFDGRVLEDWTENGMKVRQVDCTEIEAVPYDMMISGKDSSAVSVLRLWAARSVENFDMNSFSQGNYMESMRHHNEAELISKVLYPSDNHFEGKSLRLKQQYFLVSASLQNIVYDHYGRYKTVANLADKVAIHINDTHPALCIPELMRILMDDFNYSWDDAWNIVIKTVAYTNHTVMPEALEKWSEDLIERRLPRIYAIIKEINERFCAQMWEKYPGSWDLIEKMSILSHGQVRMANLSVIGSHKINGVSALHSDIIKQSVFKEFGNVYPDRFTNVTNGIAHRRWLCQSNKELTSLISDLIGDGFIKNGAELNKLKAFGEDKAVLEKLNEIKATKKKQFCDYLAKKRDIKIDPNTLFDVQAKRLHEYKRQLLNAMNVISIYNELKENPDLPMQPKTFIFAAKAAPGYYFAKEIIKLICYLAEDINKNPNPKIREKLKVVYLEDYNVSIAERLMPSAEVSEQISTAGKEASGTGNMKFMINGALTLGTLDGANVEMRELVGDDNIFIFGMTADEVDALWQRGYNASEFYNNNPRLKKVVDALRVGFNGESFATIADYLVTQKGIADPYMCMADFNDYHMARENLEKVYQDKTLWAKKSLMNIAGAGFFACDRAIKEYADNIWNLKSIK